MIRIYTKELFAVLFLTVMCFWSNQTLYAQCAAGEEEFEITVANAGFAGEVGWALYDDQNVAVASVACGSATSFPLSATACLTPGDTYTFEAYDSFGDGWNGGTITIENLDESCVIQDAFLVDGANEINQPVPGYANICTTGFGPELEFQYQFTPDAIAGCTDPTATNYVSCAVVDDGGCLYPPVNDVCSTAIPLTVQQGTCVADLTASNFAAGTSTGMPLPTCAFYTGGDIWFTVDVPASGILIINTETFNFPQPTDMSMQAYTGTCGSLTALECDDFDGPTGSMPQLNFSGLTPGETIYLMLWEDFNDTQGDFLIGAYEPPPGGTCETAEVIGLPFQSIGETTACLGDNYGTSICGNFTSNASEIVYAYTPANDLAIDVTVENGSDGVEIYIMDECPDVNPNACIDNTFTFTANATLTLQGVDLVGGTTYYILVTGDGFPADLASFDILIEENIPLSCDDPLIGVSVDITLSGFPGEVGWEIVGTELNADCGSASTGLFEACLDPNVGDYTFNAYDSFGDGWNGGTYSIEIITGPDAGCIVGFGNPGTLNGNVPDNIDCAGNNPQLEETFSFNLGNPNCISGFDCATATVVDPTDLPYIEVPGGGLGTTCGFGDAYNTGDNPCNAPSIGTNNPTEGEDRIYQLTPVEDMVVNISVDPDSDFSDPGIFVYDGCPDEATTNCVDLNFFNGTSAGALVIEELVLLAGQTYFIQVDHYSFSTSTFDNCYNYTLVIEQIPCGSEAGSPVPPNQQVCLEADSNSAIVVPDPSTPFVDAEAVAVNPPTDAVLVGAAQTAYNYIVTDLSDASSFVGVSEDGSYALPNIIGTNYCFTGIIYDPVSVQEILCDPLNADFFSSKGIGCGATLEEFITAIDPTAGVASYNVATINDALNSLCNLLPGECELCFETVAPEKTYCVGVYNCENIDCGTVLPTYDIAGAEPICEDDDIFLNGNYVEIDKEVEGINFILTWYENGVQIAQTGPGPDGVFGTEDEDLVEEYTHAADYETDNCTTTIASNEYEVQLSCIGKASDTDSYDDIVTGYFATPTAPTEFIFNFASVPLQAVAQNVQIYVDGQAINFAEASDARVSIFSPDGSDADNAPDFVTTINGTGGTAASWTIEEVLTDLSNVEVVAGVWTVQVFDGDFVENGGFPVPEGIVTSVTMAIDWITVEAPVLAQDIGLTGDTVVDIYDSAQDGVDFVLPEGCAGSITQLCPDVTIEYSTDGGATYSTTAPADLNIGDADREITYQVSINGVPDECATQGVYLQTCPCQADACSIITGDYTLVACIDDPIVLDIFSGEFEVVTDFTGDIASTGLTHIRCNGATTGSFPYENFTFQVAETGNYTITTTWAGFDGYLNLYEGPFAPSAVGTGSSATSCNNRVTFDDDFNGTGQSQIPNFTLVAGVDYTLNYTTFSGFINLTPGSGGYTTIFDGPGDILSVSTGCADPSIYGLDYLITNTDLDQIVGLGNDLTGLPEAIYTVCGFSYINGVTDPSTLIGTSYTSLVQTIADGGLCADVETAPTCVTVAITSVCDFGNCPNFITALAAEDKLCEGEPGVFEVLLTNEERWATTSINETQWTFGAAGGNGIYFITNTLNNAVYFDSNNGEADEAALTSAPIGLDGLTDATLSFDVNFQQSNSAAFPDEQLNILFLNPNTGQYDSQTILLDDSPTGCFGNPAICSQNISVEIDPIYLVNGFQVQFLFTDDQFFSQGVGLDNVLITDNTVDPESEEAVVFFDDFELGNTTAIVTWTDPEDNTYIGTEAEIPLELSGNLGNTCLSEVKEVAYSVVCRDNGEVVETGIVVVEVFPTLVEGIHYELPDQQGCELEVSTNCGVQEDLQVLYSATGLVDSFEPEIPAALSPGQAQTIFYQINTPKAPTKCAATGVYTASCPFECPSVIDTDIALEACSNSPTLFAVNIDLPFAESAVNKYNGTNISRPFWQRPVDIGPDVVAQDVRFDIFSFKAPTSGNYTFDVTFNGFNGYLHLYAGTFDPTAPLSDLIAAEDGVGTTAGITSNLVAGEIYYLVISGNTPSDVGQFSMNISGGVTNSVIHRVPTAETTWSYQNQQYVSGFPTPIRLDVLDASCGKETQSVFYSVVCTSLGAGIGFDVVKVEVFTQLEVNVDFAIPETYQDQTEGCFANLINTQCPSELIEFAYSTSPNGPFTAIPPTLANGTGIVVYYTANLIDGPAGCGVTGDSYIVACPNCPTFNEATASSSLMCTDTDVTFESDIEDGLLQVQGTITSISGTNVGGPLITLDQIFGTSPYDIFIFTVPISGAYIINQTQDYDGVLTLYQNNFDANNPGANQLAQSDNGPGGIGTSSIAVSLTAGTTYYLVTAGHADPFGFFSDGSGFEGNFTTTFTPGVSPFLQVYDLQWLYGFQGSNSGETTFTIINDQSCGVDKQNVSLEVTCRGTNEVIADTTIEMTVYPVLSPLANYFIPDPSGIAPGIPDTDLCSVDLIFDLCLNTTTELDIEYSLDGVNFFELMEDDLDTPDVDESYTIDDLFDEQTPVDNSPGTDFDLGDKDNAILETGEAALIFYQVDRPGAPAACKSGSGSFRQVCVDFDGSDGGTSCPVYNFSTVNGVDTPDIGEACANTATTFSIDIDFEIIPGLGIPNYTTQWFGPNGEQPNPLEQFALSKTYPVLSNAFCDVRQDSASVILQCVSSFPSGTSVTFPQTINVVVDIHPLPPASPADFLTFTTDGCKGIIIENTGCDLVDYVALAEPTFPLQVNEEGTAVYELNWDGGPCCAPGVELNRISDGSFEATPPGIDLPNWNLQYISADAPTLPSSGHAFLPHCDNLTCNGGGSVLNPALNVGAAGSGLIVGKPNNLWGYLWFGGINANANFSTAEYEEFASQGIRVPVNADVIEFSYLNNSCAASGVDSDFIELTIDGEQVWLQTTDPAAADEDSAPCGGGYTTVEVDVTPWADGLQHVFTFHGHFYGNGGNTNFGIDEVELLTDCDYSNAEALVEVDYSCLCGQPLDPPFGGNATGCGSVTYSLPTSVPVDNDELAIFTWTDFATGEVVPAGVEFTMDHTGGCAGVLSRTFVVEVTCSEDADFSAFGGAYTVSVYPPIEEGDFELPAPNSCSPEILITDGCGDDTPFAVFYSTDNENFSATIPADLEQGTSAEFFYKVTTKGDGQAPSSTDCVAEGQYTITCTQCPFPALVTGVEGDRCGDDLGANAEINLDGTFIAPTSVEWFINGESTGVTGTVYEGDFPAVEGCSSVTYNLTANVVCSLDNAEISIPAGSVTVYGVPVLDQDFRQPSFCSAALANVCEGVNVSYSVNGLPIDGEPTDVANGAIVAYTIGVDGAPEGCVSTGFYFYNCPECATAELAAGVEGEFCASDVDVLAAVSVSGGVNAATSCEWFINGEPTGFIGFVYQATLASADIVEPTSYNLTSVCSCTVQDGDDIVEFADPVTVDAGTVFVFPAPQLSAVSTETQSICSGESTELSVSVVNADPSDIVWTNTAGEIVGTGTTINTGEIENAVNCDGQLETFTASVAGGTVPSCDDVVSAAFEVNVLPDAGTNIAVIQDGCTVSILGICEGFTVVHRADDGPLLVGNTYTATAPAPGEISQVDVEFVITSTNGCGNLSIPAAFECFGQELGSISGIAFRDLNQDGIWQSTEEGPGLAAEIEPGMANLLVRLYRVTDTGEEINVETKFTDSQGVYVFNNLDVGTYYVLFDLPQGFIASAPDQFADENFDSDIDAGGRTDNFEINEGDDLSGVNAGMYFEGCAGNPGTMTVQTLSICSSGESVSSSASGAVVPDGYAQIYVLHDGSGATLGNVFAINEENGSFTAEEAGGFGTYYISSVVGPDNDGDGLPDLDDPCTQIASGTVVSILDGLILGHSANINKVANTYDLSVNVTGGSSSTYNLTITVTGEDEDGNVVEYYSNTVTFTEGGDPIVIPDLPLNTTYVITADDGSDCDGFVENFVEGTVAIELLDFSGEVQESGNLLNWITASEINNDFFTLYHSTDKVSFEAVSVVDGAGNSSAANSYNFLHRDAPNGVSYYRLDQTDFDGTTSSSNVISLVRGEGGFGIIEVLPVPARDFVNLTFTSIEDVEVTGQLHSVNGKALATFKVNAKGGLNTIKVDVSKYPIGVYLLTINNGNQLLSTKVIKE